MNKRQKEGVLKISAHSAHGFSTQSPEATCGTEVTTALGCEEQKREDRKQLCRCKLRDPQLAVPAFCVGTPPEAFKLSVKTNKQIKYRLLTQNLVFTLLLFILWILLCLCFNRKSDIFKKNRQKPLLSC